MKKLLALFIVFVIVDLILAAALYVQKVQEANARIASQFANQMSGSDATRAAGMPVTSSPSAGWPTMKAEFIQTATAETKPPIAWSIAVIQDGEQVAEQDGVYRMKRAPFTLRARVPRQVFDELPFVMYLNGLDRDQVYQKVQPGSIKDAACEVNVGTCFSFSGFAEPGNSNESLALSLKNGVGTHLLYYRDAEDTRWDKAEFLDTEVVLERDVFKIILIEGENNLQEVPVEAYSGEVLYLVFLLDYRAGAMVTEDELKKAVLRFE